MDEHEIADHLIELVREADAGDTVTVSGSAPTEAANFILETPTGDRYLVLVVRQ